MRLRYESVMIYEGDSSFRFAPIGIPNPGNRDEGSHQSVN